VGVAEAGAEDRLEDLLHRADAALYAAKRAGRNQVSVGSSSDIRA
jgi:PleD family two-component response regulator